MMFTMRQMRDLWAKIDTRGADDCWLWTGGRNSAGYGSKRLSIDGVPGSMLVHRMVWMVFNSDIPEGLIVCHKCDVKTCCNPAHMFLGTHKDNTKDMMTKRRGNVPMFSEEQVAEVRALKAAGETLRSIAKQMGTSTMPVRKALREGLN